MLSDTKIFATTSSTRCVERRTSLKDWKRRPRRAPPEFGLPRGRTHPLRRPPRPSGKSRVYFLLAVPATEGGRVMPRQPSTALADKSVIAEICDTECPWVFKSRTWASSESFTVYAVVSVLLICLASAGGVEFVICGCAAAACGAAPKSKLVPPEIGVAMIFLLQPTVIPHYRQLSR